GFDGHNDTPVEVVHVVLFDIIKYLYCDLIAGLSVDKKEHLIARIQSFDTSNLNIPQIKAKYLVQYFSSLVGNNFKILTQAAPFVFFLITEGSKRKIWISLCNLSSTIFQTHISNCKKYLANLTYYMQNFLLKLISTTAQWVNKPNFHILLHISHSILRFRPASLFATEKFESYNCQLATYSEPLRHKQKQQNITYTKIDTCEKLVPKDATQNYMHFGTTYSS
ncbi:hypothetical protein BY996DRAFT_4599269, partial [Phakopsora pachyrhizi]